MEQLPRSLQDALPFAGARFGFVSVYFTASLFIQLLPSPGSRPSSTGSSLVAAAQGERPRPKPTNSPCGQPLPQPRRAPRLLPAQIEQRLSRLLMRRWKITSQVALKKITLFFFPKCWIEMKKEVTEVKRGQSPRAAQPKFCVTSTEPQCYLLQSARARSLLL